VDASDARAASSSPDDPFALDRRGSTGVRPHPAVIAAVALGAALGAPARYEISRALPVGPGAFPWSTLLINTSGSLALGWLLTLVLERWPPSRYVRPFAAVGFLGAYTTFSTYSVEADLLLKRGHVGIAVAYTIGSVVAALAAVWAGIAIGRARTVGRRT
jgi:CrcB protein